MSCNDALCLVDGRKDRYVTMLAGYGFDMVNRMAKRFDVPMPSKEELA